MIPFDVEPTLYYLCGISIFFTLLSAIAFCLDISSVRSVWGIFAVLFLLLTIIIMYSVVVCFSIYTDTITICKHTEGDYMKVIDTNDNLYYVTDYITQMKVKDSDTIKVKIENKFGTKYIYYIDAPIQCNNSTCGVSPT